MYLDLAPDTIRQRLQGYAETIVSSPSPGPGSLKQDACAVEPMPLSSAM